jgi:WD40 repeat-containing protein SMU1
MEVELQDVTKLILQFFKEQGLLESFEVAQRETGVFLNTVRDIDSLRNDILEGKWDTVLAELAQLKLSIGTLVRLKNLYDLFVVNFVEHIPFIATTV